MTEIYDAALTWLQAGFNVIPAKADGTKAPLISWKRRQNRRSTEAELAFWYTHPDNTGLGVGLVCGAVSGGLEMLELEGRATGIPELTRIDKQMRADDLEELWTSLLIHGYSEQTPGGGLHILYRITNHAVPGNTKIARRPATEEELEVNSQDKVKTMVETRGEGGFVVVAPSGGRVHPTGRPWTVLHGELGVVPMITWDERCRIHAALAAALDEPLPVVEYPGTPVRTTVHHGSSTRPGDVFNQQATWEQILEPHGWRIHPDRGRGGETLWTRPGKEHRDGHSATTGYANDADRLFVFSSSTLFTPELPYTKFAAWTLLNHRGDFAAAVRDLVAQGYGEPLVHAPAPMGTITPPERGETVSSPLTSVRQQLLPEPKGSVDYTFSGAATRFVNENGQYIRYVHESKLWRVWDGVTWTEDQGGSRVMRAFEAMTEVMRAEVKTMDPEADVTKAYSKHVAKLRDSGRTTLLNLIASKVTVSASDFDANPRYLNLANGILDTKTTKILPHEPAFMMTKVAGVSYDPDAVAPQAEKFLVDVLPDAELREYVLQALGYSLTGDNDQRAFMMLHGPSGTGKTQFIEMVQAILGDYGVTAMADTFHKRNNSGGPTADLHALQGARFISTSETGQETRLDEDLIKRFTGRDQISSRTLHEKPVVWTPQGVIWFATNHLPKFSSEEDAIWRRVKTIPFTTQFSDDGSVGQKGEPNLGRKLAAAEASGILNLILAALARYRDAGYMVEPAPLKQAVAEHKREVDPLAQCWDEFTSRGTIEEFPDGRMDFAVFRPIYETWCRDNGYMPVGPRRLGRSLRTMLNINEFTQSNGRTYIDGWRIDPTHGFRGSL